jgi:putative transposase
VIAFIDMMRAKKYRVESVCRVLGEYGIKIAARTYRAFKTRQLSARAIRDQQILDKMIELRQTPDENGRLPRERFYGRRKMVHLMRRQPGFETVAYCTVARLMRAAGMTGLRRGRPKVTTVKTREPSAGDALNRDFTAARPDAVWVTDLTYVHTGRQWCYVGFMTDCFSRRIIGWAVSNRMTAQLVSDVLTDAIWNREHAGRPIGSQPLLAHSDHGSQYTSVRYGEQLTLAGITASYGSVGDAYDNALAETINGTFKTECVTPDGPFTSLEELRWATADWVNWYNNHRLHETLSYQTPAETENQYYKQQQAQTGQLQTTTA